MPDWTEMAVFDGVDLYNSYVLGWSYGADVGGLRFELDALLGPDHPAYTDPTEREWGCFKRSVLLFHEAAVSGELPAQADVRPAIDASGEADYDGIWHLVLEDGWYHLETNFADVTLRCSEVTFTVLE